MLKRMFAILLCVLLLTACGAPAEIPAAPAESPTVEETPAVEPAETPEIPVQREEPTAEAPPAEEKPAEAPPVEAEKPAAPATPAPAPAKPREFPPLHNPALEEEEDAAAKYLSSIDFDTLRQMNGDTKGWIYQPGTSINYPIVQAGDNEYYLNRTYEKQWNSQIGAIYIDYRNDGGMDDFNTILYGHDLTTDVMFSSLNNYIDDPAAYHLKRPSLYVATVEGRIFRYDVFAACEAPVPGSHWRLGLDDFDGRQAYIDYCSYYNNLLTNVMPSPADHILTLSTCTGRGHHSRCVVQFVRAKEYY